MSKVMVFLPCLPRASYNAIRSLSNDIALFVYTHIHFLVVGSSTGADGPGPFPIPLYIISDYTVMLPDSMLRILTISKQGFQIRHGLSIALSLYRTGDPKQNYGCKVYLQSVVTYRRNNFVLTSKFLETGYDGTSNECVEASAI